MVHKGATDSNPNKLLSVHAIKKCIVFKIQTFSWWQCRFKISRKIVRNVLYLGGVGGGDGGGGLVGDNGKLGISRA